ncbi:MAG TPA: DUF202 domain-containing protein [Candidatus Dormibacteraeota bacterium]|nr:DUF202 domain-containing protein [Candidatus Dormibacteraeota bacterium]
MAGASEAPAEVEPDVRFTYANERTFLAWNRTAPALIATGVAATQLLSRLRLSGAEAARRGGRGRELPAAGGPTSGRCGGASRSPGRGCRWSSPPASSPSAWWPDPGRAGERVTRGLAGSARPGSGQHRARLEPVGARRRRRLRRDGPRSGGPAVHYVRKDHRAGAARRPGCRRFARSERRR